MIASPVLAGILLLIATIADPGAGITGHEMNQAYTDNPGALQLHSLRLHWSYAFWASRRSWPRRTSGAGAPASPTSPPSSASSA